MVKVIFFENGKQISSRIFKDSFDAEIINRYINEVWKENQCWEMWQDDKRVSFKKLFNREFRFKEKKYG